MRYSQTPRTSVNDTQREVAFTQEDAQVMKALRKITAKGNNAEVRRKKDGSLQVYEVQKNIVSVGQ